MTSGVLGTAITGLQAFQRSLETTSHNIANANTEGYSRQRVELATNKPEYTGGGYLGTGVHVSNISRSYDQFINTQLRSSSSAYGEVDTYHSYATEIDNLLADSSTGLDPAIQSFFDATNDVANDPSSITARAAMIADGENLSHRFGLVSGRMQEIREHVNSDLKRSTELVNRYTTEIASLNKEVNESLAKANNEQQPNDLLDKRDNLINKLAKLMDISVIPQSTGMVTVIMSNGLPLVIDAQSSELGIQGNDFDPTKLEVIYIPLKGNSEVITDKISGGEIAGALSFRAEVLDPAQQKTGAVAAAIAMEFNAIHQAKFDLLGNPVSGGYDLDGNAGLIFFKFDGVSEVPAIDVSAPESLATVTAAFSTKGADSANLDTSDYLLEYDGANYTLTRLNDDSVIALSAAVGPPIALTPTNVADKLPGITLELDVAPAANDQFFIRPTYSAASNLAMNISDPRKIAAATNLDIDGITVINGPMVGDNRNVLSLAELANNTGMFGGTASFQESYGQIVSKVGGLTQSAEIRATAQQAVLDRATEARENVAGVNLDEEAANLIKFQQSYQAAAQVIAIAGSLFDTLLNASR